jgi:hypothetical protein
LKREKDAGKSLANCRPVSAIAQELSLSQSEFNRAFAFLSEKRAISAADRKDGKAVLPSDQGEALLTTEREKTAWTFDRRLALYPILIALISLALVVIGLSQCMRK